MIFVSHCILKQTHIFICVIWCDIKDVVNILPMSIVLALYLNDNKLNPLSCILDFHFLFSVCILFKHLLFILPGTNIYLQLSPKSFCNVLLIEFLFLLYVWNVNPDALVKLPLWHISATKTTLAPYLPICFDSAHVLYLTCNFKS
jgi:hypothetical protein